MIIDKIKQKGDEISVLEGTDRLQYLIDIAKDAEPLEEIYKIEQNKILGCASNLWVVGKKNHHDNMRYNFDADAFITKGTAKLVIDILNLMITMLIISIPGFIISFYVYFSIESNVDLATSIFANVIFTLGFAMFLLAFIYSQALSQVAYGVLYYNIYEENNNVFLRSKIDQIGVNE